MRTHTDRRYAAQLKELRENLLLMAGRVEQMIEQAMHALVERDAELAKKTIAADTEVNRSELATDELCLVILAQRQPMASDLRFITLSLKMVTDLERIGDLAVNIAERAIDLAAMPPMPGPYIEIPRMAAISQAMVREAIDAFVNEDMARAEAVIARDDEVDELYTKVFRDLMKMMHDDPALLERGIHVQSVAKWLERVADHATNLAEQVIFMVRGKDVRHIGKRGAE